MKLGFLGGRAQKDNAAVYLERVSCFLNFAPLSSAITCTRCCARLPEDPLDCCFQTGSPAAALELTRLQHTSCRCRRLRTCRLCRAPAWSSPRRPPTWTPAARTCSPPWCPTAGGCDVAYYGCWGGAANLGAQTAPVGAGLTTFTLFLSILQFQGSVKIHGHGGC